MMKADNVRQVGAVVGALFIIVYGMWQIGKFAEAGLLDGAAIVGIYGSLIGGAVLWLLSSESVKQATKGFQSGVDAGAKSTATTVNTSGSPTIVNPTNESTPTVVNPEAEVPADATTTIGEDEA